MRPDDLFLIFAAVWIALGIGLWVFSRRASYQLKKQWHLVLVAGAALFFISFAYALSSRASARVAALACRVRVCSRAPLTVQGAAENSMKTLIPNISFGESSRLSA